MSISKRISADAWCYIKSNYPDDIKTMHCLEMPIFRYNINSLRRRKKSSKKQIKKLQTNIQKYGEQLGSIIDWLDENCNDLYYAEYNKNKPWAVDLVVKFYFMEETDAMGFKLTFK